MSPTDSNAKDVRRFYIYGKHQSQRNFRPMDLSKGERVGNLIYASMLTEESVTRFMEREAPKNPDWTFEPRPIRARNTVQGPESFAAFARRV